MADCTALPSGVHAWLKRERGRAVVYGFRGFSSSCLRRGIIFRKKEIVALGLQRSSAANLSFPAHLIGHIHHGARNLRFRCLSSLANPEGLTPQWVPVIDQILLTVSIFLAYMGGVVPQDKRHFPTGNHKIKRDTEAGGLTSSGRAAERVFTSDVGDLWSTVREKLWDALKRTENESSNRRISGHDETVADSSLSLLAVAESPRLQLLWITLQRLHNEVNNISQSQKGISRNGWLSLSYQLLWGTVQQIGAQWFEGKNSLKNSKMEMEFLPKTLKKFRDDGSLRETLKRMGKSELYADLLYFLRFGSLGDGHIFNYNFLTEHGVQILEDLVITLADGISGIYLELISIDSSVAEEMNSLDLNLCVLSTREIQRIRNEVALRQWITQNFQSVASMYEDRIDLWVLQVRQQERLTKMETQRANWWSQLMYGRQESTLLSSLQVSRSLVRVKRTKELRALIGWRYYYSLFLELSDVAMPLVRIIVSKGRDAISFLLTCLVGRSLGLIYTGIRQALGFRVHVWHQNASMINFVIRRQG
ncbi:phosphoglycolate phosphatase isoform X2 [Wolffia australiana]